MRSITYLRHGESTGNAAGVIQGRGSSPLSETGRRQAVAVGKRLRNQHFDRVISSDMERAVETAHGLDRPFATDALWREMDVGGWDGLTNEEIAEQFAEELLELRGGEDLRLGGTGERLSEMLDRVGTAQRRALDQLEDGQSALVVCHGGVIETVVGLALGIKDPHRRLARVTNTALTTLVEDGGRIRLARFNDGAHLDPLPGWAVARLHDGALVLGLVRHGRTAANASGHWQGQTDAGLNNEGRRQAAALAGWYGGFEEVYSSPLGRALETARVLANGSTPVTHPDLAELSMGDWEGHTRPEIVAGWPDLWDGIYEQLEDLPRGNTGETWAETQERVARAIADLTEGRKGEHLGIVSHGAAIRSYLSRILGLDHGTRLKLGVPANSSVSHVVIEADRPVLADFNVAPHLE